MTRSPSSSHDLHPDHGARLVATKIAGPPDGALEYEVEVLLPGHVRLSTRLSWIDGRASLDASWDDAWAVEEVLKLARVLKRTQKAREVRWRGRDIHKDDPIDST
jgi:hypothetical protein